MEGRDSSWSFHGSLIAWVAERLNDGSGGLPPTVARGGKGITLLRALPVFSERLGFNGKCDIVEVRPLIHHLESICVFGVRTINPPALDLCWEHGVAVNYLSQLGYLQARLTGVADTSVTLRRAQFRAADSPARCAAIARQIIAGKLQNSRNSLLRAARETGVAAERDCISTATDTLARQLQDLGRWTPEELGQTGSADRLRGAEGVGAVIYFGVFGLLLKQQRDEFAFVTRSRRPPRDHINCLLSFLYALVRHDCIAALTSIGLDPFVGYLRAERPNRPALALALMEEFRPWLAQNIVRHFLAPRTNTSAQTKKKKAGQPVRPLPFPRLPRIIS